MKKIVGLFIIVISIASCAMLKGGEKKTAVIQTNAECGMCKDRIENKLNYERGIIFAELNVSTKELTVKHNVEIITLADIRKIVSEIGYDADEVKANPTAQEELPACCQPGGMD